MKYTSIVLGLVTMPFLVGCGSGSSTTPSSALQTAKLTGTVPGTKIEAFCDNNVYKEIKSVYNGTDKHPFTLEVPKDTDCRIVMTTNEDNAKKVVITHLKFEDDKGNQSIIINISGDEVDLGHIPLPMSIEEVDDANMDHVKDTPLVVNLTSLSISIVVRDNDSFDDDNDDIIDPYEDDDDYDDNENDNYDNDNSYYTPSVLPTAYTPDPGRLLGSQCAQCHGTNGVSVNKWDSIAGEDKLHEEMFEEGSGHIMTAQAKGYTLHEINLMETWLQTLKYKD